MKKIVLLLAALLALLSPTSIPAQGNTVSMTSIKLLKHDGSPLQGARVAATGVPQVPQVSNETGATQWNVASGVTYSFNVQFKLSPSSFSTTHSFDVRLFISGATSEQTIRLPKLITSRLPLKGADEYGSDLFDVRWQWFFPTSIEVNGKSQLVDYGFGAPNVLQISSEAGGKFAILQYFEPTRLRVAESSDLDGDLIPDNAFAIVTPYSSVTYVLPSKTMESSPPSISLAQVPWVKAVPKNEGIDLALMLGSEDVTSTFPDGTFAVHQPAPTLFRGGQASGLRVNGAKAEYQWGPTGGVQSVIFTYSVNQVMLGLSSQINFEIKPAICWDNAKGSIRQFRTLGDCPTGWVSTASVRKLSEKKHSTCSALNKVLVGGVGRTDAFNIGKRAFKGWLAHNAGYLKNKHLDADRDGIACER